MSAAGNPTATPGTLGYDRALEWKEPPAPEEIAWCGWSVVRAAGRPAARWLPLARIGAVRLYLCPPGSETDADRVFGEPLIAHKRGTPARGGYVGVDGHVRTGLPHLQVAPSGSSPGSGAAPAAPAPAPTPASAATAIAEDTSGIRIAVIDVGFENLEVLRPFDLARVEGPFPSAGPLGAAARAASAGPSLSRAPGHGTAMAGILLHEVAGARVGLFPIPSIAGAVPAYAGPTEIAVAVAAAVEAWRADVVLIAMSDGAWGTPRHLRDVLREAARTGRRTRGTAIFCSVGDPAKNHSRAEDSAAMGADDLASQPWVFAVASCDPAGRWQRATFDYNDASAPGATYNRFGPSVVLSAPGEARLYAGVLAADDSSQAAALAAAAAARVLQVAPATTADQLRAILSLTADVPPEVDGHCGLAAAACPGRDRLGHSFKVGYGRVNGAAAALVASDPIALALFATRPSPDPPAGVKSFAQHLAEAWEATWPLWAGPAESPGAARLAADYARVRGVLARHALRSLAAGDALAWLARHARAVGETECSSWFSASQDHGALVDRIQHVADIFAHELRLDDGDGDAREARAWIERFTAALGSSGLGGDGGVEGRTEGVGPSVSSTVGAVLRAALRRARGTADLQTSRDFSPDGRPPAPATPETGKDGPCTGETLLDLAHRGDTGCDAGGDTAGDKRGNLRCVTGGGGNREAED